MRRWTPRAGRGDLWPDPGAIRVERAVRRLPRRRVARVTESSRRISCRGAAAPPTGSMSCARRSIGTRAPTWLGASGRDGARSRSSSPWAHDPEGIVVDAGPADAGRSEHRVRVQLVVLRGGRGRSARAGGLSWVGHAAQTRRRAVHGDRIQSTRQDRVVSEPDAAPRRASRRAVRVRGGRSRARS